jgi:hypothetical protein
MDTFVESAMRGEFTRLTKKYNKGKPFTDRPGQLRGSGSIWADVGGV